MLLPLRAFSEGVPMAGILSIDFEKDKIGIVAIEGNNWKAFDNPNTYAYYYEFNPKTGSLVAQKRESYYQLFPSAIQPQGIDPYGYLKDWPSVSQNGTDYKAKQEKCEPQEEGDPICKELNIEIDRKKLNIGGKEYCRFGCRVRAIENWDNQIWVGLYINGELQPYGEGLYVWDKKTLKKLYGKKAFFDKGSNAFGNPDLIPTVIKKNPAGKEMWIGTNMGVLVFNKQFEEIGRCRAEVSTKKKKFSLSCGKFKS